MAGLTQLKDPISYADLVESGAHFEIVGDFQENNDDDFLDCDDNNEFISTEELASPWTHSFKDLCHQMVPINKYIHKRVTRVGKTQLGTVPDKARVALRYSAYWEGEGAPFDSSVLRGTKYEFVTGKGEVIEGLELAVKSMCPNERAEFVISYHLLFREMGCPPRVKPRADGLFKVEVISFTLVGDGSALDGLSDEDRNKFKVVYPKVKELQLQGKDCVQRRSYHKAVDAFENASTALAYCSVADEEEEHKQTELLITLYTNLMICYNKISRPKRTCIMMNNIRRLTSNKPSCKAIFQEGRALMTLGEYKRARALFLQAHALTPGNKEINDEIFEVDKRIQKYEKNSRDMWSRAFGIKEDESKDPTFEELNAEAIESFTQIIKDFQNYPKKKMILERSLYTDKEFEIMRTVAAKNQMLLGLLPIDDTKIELSKISKDSAK